MQVMEEILTEGERQVRMEAFSVCYSKARKHFFHLIEELGREVQLTEEEFWIRTIAGSENRTGSWEEAWKKGWEEMKRK